MNNDCDASRCAVDEVFSSCLISAVELIKGRLVGSFGRSVALTRRRGYGESSGTDEDEKTRQEGKEGK